MAGYVTGSHLRRGRQVLRRQLRHVGRDPQRLISTFWWRFFEIEPSGFWFVAAARGLSK